MEVSNQVMPTEPEQIKAMMQPGPEGPITMVNLLKFKDRAEYEDGRKTNLTGKEAYALYGVEVSKLIQEFGGRVVWSGEVTHLTLGLVEELWDQVAMAEYPNRAALVAMSTSDEYREIAVHRTAGLAGQLNIETVAATAPGSAS